MTALPTERVRAPALPAGPIPTDAPATLDALAEHLRARVFPSPAASGAQPRIGAEAELIPVHAASGRPLPLEGTGHATLDILRRAGAPLGWREQRSEKASVPELHLPGGGRISFEPGGQLEISSPPCRSASELIDHLRMVVGAVRNAAPPEIALLSVGLDPQTPLEEVEPQLDADRYRRMLAHFDRIGGSGARMMRQTASFQVCVDGGAVPERTWSVLNALAPYVVAIFANSPRYSGRDTGWRSFRRRIWATLDPCRTGIAGISDDPVEDYLRFALTAPAFLVGDATRARPFGEWVARGAATMSDWCAHLSTLFPEVRPRGYFELRSADAVPPEWYAAPLALVGGIVYDGAALAEAAELLGAPEPLLLDRAGRCALADPEIAATAVRLWELALTGCASLGSGFMRGDDLARAHEFAERYTRRGRSPADDR